MSADEPRTPAGFWTWLVQSAMRLYPWQVRVEYGTEIEDVVHARVENARRTQGAHRRLAFQMRELKGLIRAGLQARRERWAGGGGTAPHRSGGRNQKTDKAGLLTGTLADIRLALRGLRNAPGFTLAAVAILALGMGANVTAFSALKVAILTPPPFPEPERLVSVELTRTQRGGAAISRWAYPYVQRLIDWPDRLVDPVTSYRHHVVTLTGLGPARQFATEVVSPGYFDVVGRPLTLGRGFREEEADPAGPYRVVVASHAFWSSTLGGEASAIGRDIELNGETFRVIGVAPSGFSGFGGGAALWVPTGAYAVFQPGVLEEAGNHLAWVVGRLRPGSTLDAADAQMRVIGGVIAEAWPREDTYGARLRAFEEVWTNPGARTASMLLAFAAGLVLLVACANLAGLLLTRARRRVRAWAVRRALGANRWRLIRSVLVESLAISALGGIAGLGVSVWGMRLLSATWPAQFLAGNNVGVQVINPAGLALDARALIFAFAITLFTTLLIGLIPALRGSSFNLTDHLKDGAGATMHRRRVAGVDTHAVLVGAQISLALMLLVGVGLMGSTIRRLLRVDEGFRAERLLSFEYSTPRAVPRLDPRNETTWRSHIVLTARFDDQLQDRLKSLPTIEGVAFSSGAILKHFEAVLGIVIDDGETGPREAGSVGAVPVSDNYFDVLGIPVLRGRGFTSSDGLRGPPVVILSQSAASRYFPDQDPIGKRVTTGFALPGRETAEVVGVVGDVIYTGPAQQRWPVAYYSLRERSGPRTATIRTTGDPFDAVQVIQDEILALDPTVAMRNVTTVERLIAGSLGDRRLLFWLLTIFAAVTVLLAAVGTWGVVAYAVAIRQRELGLRLALGAGRTRVLRLVLRRSAVTALVGVALGLLGAWAGSRVLEAFLWNTSARDLRVFLGGGALLLVVVLGASYLPARRAIRVDPVEVLRAAE